MVSKGLLIISIVFVVLLLVAGCTTSSNNPIPQSTIRTPAGVSSVASFTSHTTINTPVTTSRSFVSAGISKSVLKTSDTFTIRGEATDTPQVTVNIVIRRCQDPNTCSTFDPNFNPKTYQPVVSDGKYSQSINAAEFGPGLFHAIISMPSTGQFTNLRFFIEE